MGGGTRERVWIEILFALFFFLVLVSSAPAHQKAIGVNPVPRVLVSRGPGFPSEYLRLEGVIHLDTNIGGGDLSPEEMVKKVREAGIKIAVITDHDNMKVEYGLPPLRNIIKKTVDKGGIRKYGSERYIKTIEALKARYPDMLILHGTEAVPFYYWEGDPFSGLTLKNWHKHILILGLKDPQDYERLPSISSGYPSKLDIGCLKNLWPFITFIGGFILLGKKREKVYRVSGFTLREKVMPYRLIGILLLVMSLISFFNNYPFCEPLFDQYHGDKGIRPYQTLIDYVNQKDALTFWAHPEVETTIQEGKVKLYTSPYYEDLLRAKGYTGFAVFAEGYKKTGRPGGIWDHVLREFCEGKRDRPIWAIGELDYKVGGWMGETQTVFFLRDFNEGEALEALRKGRVYAVRGKDKPILEYFSAKGTQGEAIMGEELSSKEGVEVSIRLKTQDLRQEAKIFLIRNGYVIETFSPKTDSLTNEFLIKYRDDYFRPGEKIYYRLVVGAIHELPLLVTNPIFVRFEG